MKLRVIPVILAAGATIASVHVAFADDPAPPLPASETVEPNDPAFTNGDGVTVTNNGDEGDGNFVISPKSGNSSDQTTVDAKNNAHGTVDDIDGNDTVNCAYGSNGAISGTGGTVNVSPGASGTVHNTNPVNPPGGASITIRIGGGTIQVPPGATVPFSG